MSQLAGIYWFDRRPVDSSCRPAALSQVSDGQTKEAPGLCMAWDPALAVSQAAETFCTLDGRVDRTTIAAAGAVALRLYQQSGAVGLGELIGDWSLSLWDGRSQALVLASDYAGTRPLYYFQSPDFVAWSSSLDHLAQWMDCRRLDREYIAAFIGTGYPRQLTPYSGIHPVPAGCAVSISAGKTIVTELWHPPAACSIRYADESEYEERFRSLFEEAVSVRLESSQSVAAELSGGLDSSSIVCMADHLVRSGNVSSTRLATFSYFAPDSPDHRFIRIAEQACPSITPMHLEGGDFPVLTPSTPGGSLPIWAEARLIEVRRHMREMGLNVLLTGQLGDLITGNLLDDSDQAADYFRRGAFRAGFKEAMAWSQALHVPVYGMLWRALCGAAGVGAGEHRHTAPSQRLRLRGLNQLRMSRFFQCPEPLTGMLYSHPFTHRPLVEFLLAVPPGIVCRPGEPRRLLRRALRGIVPDAILRRKSKGNYEGMFLESLRPCAADLLRSSAGLWLSRMGCVDPQKVTAGLTKVSDGLPFSVEIQQVIRLEHWLRHNIQRGSIAVGDLGIPEMGIV
jgi:asparagine synthase (glutamine-hydrolysing)